MKAHNIPFYFLIGLLISLSACKKEEVSLESTFELYVEYCNEDGQSPLLSFDGNNSSDEVKIDPSSTFTGELIPPNITNILLNNIRIIDNRSQNYEIKEIQAFEYRDEINDWKEDVEFGMSFDLIEDLDIIMVLDASLSLGEDFDKVKSFASRFVENVFEATPTAEIGIVAFSDELNYLRPTNNRSAVLNYISKMRQGAFTALYDAISMGIDSLSARDARGKALLTFTDGTDNYSIPENAPEALVNKLVDDPNAVKINSFTIGLEGKGGVDTDVLQNLAANRGAAEFPGNIKQLEEVFDKFSKAISNVYNLTYIRNQQVVLKSDPVRLRFLITAEPK
ncbi:MAG: vWA domain-containing protein [Bacteroidota bacterium]